MCETEVSDGCNSLFRIGRKFSVTSWEKAAKTMKAGECARFTCDKEQSAGFVPLAVVLRKEDKRKRAAMEKEDHHHHHHHCDHDYNHDDHNHNHNHGHNSAAAVEDDGHHSCGANFMRDMQENSDLFRYQGIPLVFEFEMLEVQEPGSFQREAWELTNEEKFAEVAIVKDQGNALFKEARYDAACEKYAFAIGLTEALLASTQWEASAAPDQLTQTDEFNLSLRLNYAAGKIKLRDYEPAIAQCTEVLRKDKANQKALFRRGQAYLRVGRDLELAQKDLDALAALNPSLPDLKAEQKLLQEKQRAAREKEKKMFGDMFNR